MNQQSLIFLNATGAPVLSRADTRQMRAHITKTNFAKRRQRISGVEAQQKESDNEMPQQLTCQRKKCHRQILRTTPGTVQNGAEVPARASFSRHPSPVQLLRYFRYLVFLDSRPTLEDPVEIAWFDLMISEPVLFEASLAGGMRWWGPDQQSQQSAALHLLRATSLLIDRVSCGQVASDATVGAVMTLAFGERLANNDAAWNVHMEGLIQMMQQRRQQGISILPPVYFSLIALDFTNHLLGFPRFYHLKVVDILRNHGSQIMSVLACISNDISLLRKASASDQADCRKSKTASQEDEEPLARLRHATQAIRTHRDPYIKATCRSLELYLSLIWPLSFPTDLGLVARELKDAMSEFRIKACPFMELTSPHYILGLLAAEEASDTRIWFLDKLQGSVQVMRHRGWSDPVGLMKMSLKNEPQIQYRFNALWDQETTTVI